VVRLASLFLIPNATFFVGLLVLAGGVVIAVFGVVDAAVTPDASFRAAGKSKVSWIVAIAATTIVFLPMGGVVAIYYLVAVRPKVHPHHA
jgi:Na+-driven multidrug efflux pump